MGLTSQRLEDVADVRGVASVRGQLEVLLVGGARLGHVIELLLDGAPDEVGVRVGGVGGG